MSTTEIVSVLLVPALSAIFMFFKWRDQRHFRDIDDSIEKLVMREEQWRLAPLSNHLTCTGVATLVIGVTAVQGLVDVFSEVDEELRDPRGSRGVPVRATANSRRTRPGWTRS